ncbi:MAG TPA: glycosyltransferase family 1 protein [Acidobacteriota bacterium]|nr:glycosyltransferase family 1 protein [Acidobacteriota bacterium]
MKIGIDVRKLKDYGIGTHIQNVILPAIQMDDQNQYVLFCSPHDLQKDLHNATWVAESSSKYSVREHYSLAKRAKDQNVDLFHSPHYTLPLALKKPAIVTVHDLIQFKFPQYYPAWKVRAGSFVLKRVLEKADVVLTVSQTSKKDIVEAFPFTESKIQVVYNRLSPDWIKASSSVDLSSLGIEKDFILYVGNFKRHKGVEILLDAFHTLKDPPQLVLAGKPDQTESELIEKCFATPRVRVLGFAEGKLLRSLYANAMLFVFPSMYEGFGYPPLEAMSCGTAVLSSDAPALCEILGDSVEFFQRGSVESLAEKLEILVHDLQRLSHLRSKGPGKAKEYMTDQSPRQLLAIYQRFVR